jgi:hypothetical protein
LVALGCLPLIQLPARAQDTQPPVKSSPPSAASKETSVDASRPASKSDGTVTEHFQVRRVAAKIQEIGNKSFDELVANMDDLWVKNSSGAVMIGIIRGMDFPFTLANRNTRRLVAELQLLEPEKRRQLCRDIFDKYFARHKRFYTETLKRLSEGAANGSQEGTKTHLAVCNALFLTATFCDVADLAVQLRKLIELRAYVSEQLESITDAPASVHQMMPKSVCPDDEFVMSLLVYNAETVESGDPGVAAKIQQIINDATDERQVRSHKVTLVGWNAKIDWYDLAFFKEHVALDRSQGAVMVEDFYWRDSGKKKQEQLMAKLMACLP